MMFQLSADSTEGHLNQNTMDINSSNAECLSTTVQLHGKLNF